MSTIQNNKPYTIAIFAMGGQGGGVLANWLVDLAQNNGFFAQSTSVPGVAQRTGATLYYLEMFPIDNSDNTKVPYFSLSPFEYDVDLVIAAELMEGARSVQKNLITPQTTAIISAHRSYSIVEKSAKTAGPVEDKILLDTITKATENSVIFDMDFIAKKHKGIISAAMFGAIAGVFNSKKSMPFTADNFKKVIEDTGKMVATNLAIFEQSYIIAQNPEKFEQVITANNINNKLIGKLERLISIDLPHNELAIVREGIKQCYAFQNYKYAQTYWNFLQEIFLKYENTLFRQQLSRYLTLFMCYEDIAQVAKLKISKSRFKIVAKSVLATDKVFYLEEYLHPRVQEICDVLPYNMAKSILAGGLFNRLIDKLFCGRKTLKTNSLLGFLQFKLISSLASLRKFSFRYKTTQQDINTWLGKVEKLADKNIDLAATFVTARGLIKGYGKTHEESLELYQAIDDYCTTESSNDVLKVFIDTALKDRDIKSLQEMIKNAK